VSCAYWDNETANLESFDFFLYSRVHDSPTPVTLASREGAPPGNPVGLVRWLSDATVSGAGDPIDNTSYQYSLRVRFETMTNSQSLYFYGCRIRFGMDSADSY